MLQIFHFVTLFLVLAVFSSFSFVTNVYAISPNGGQCLPDHNTNVYRDSINLVPREFPAWDFVCDDNLECVPKNPSSNFGVGPQQEEFWCQPRQAPIGTTELHCKCQHNESTAPTENGYTCNRADNGQPYSQNNVTVDYCRFGDICVDGTLDTGREIILNGESLFTNVTIKGISCRPEERVANCTCAGDRVSCTDGGNTQEAACKANHFCTPANGQTLDPFDLEDRNFMPGVLKKNVQCAPKKANCNCKNPGVPGQGEMECTFEGQTATDKCDPMLACVEEEDLTKTVSRSDMEGNIFPNVDLTGVLCKQPGEAGVLHTAPPLPPVPPPPCADGKLIEGICTAFSTGLGIIATDESEFFLRLFGILLAAAGAFAVLLIMKAGYLVMTSAGKPEQLQSGKDQFYAAVVGLLLIIFCFVFLEVLNVHILKLPGFAP